MITPNVEPIFKQLFWYSNASIHFKIDSGLNLINNMHYHPEMELILLKRCTGTRIIGSSIDHFSHNEVLLIGKNVPHVFLHEEQPLSPNGNPAPEAVVVQFRETFFKEEFLNLPELTAIRRFSNLARYGLRVTNDGKKVVIPLIERMSDSSSLKRILLLLEILDTLISNNCYTILTDNGFISDEVDDRISKVIEFTSKNYDRNIKIDELASIINLTKESFCRYFKSQTGRTFMEFLIDFRISRACQMLLENRKTIKEIGYSCGFDSLSNFHHQFKKIMAQSPLEYKRSAYHRGKQNGYNPDAAPRNEHTEPVR